MHNWAGNITYSVDGLARPRSVSELQETVAAATRIRAVGSGHSFNDVIDCTGTLVTTAGLPQTIEVQSDGPDAGAATVEVPGSATYAEVGAALHQQGWALPNMGSLPHISVAGACATGTHGSGVGNGCLATSVVGIELVRADGELVTSRAGDPDFPGMVLSLGSIGVVTRLWLAVQPTYDVAQDVLLDVPTSVVAEHGTEMLSSAWSVSLFTTWRTPGSVDSVWRKHRVDAGPAPVETWSGRRAEVAVHPIVSMDAAAATEQLGRPGPWHERLPHFRAAFMPSAGDELQSEFFVPLDSLGAVWSRLRESSASFSDALQVMEIRTIAPDELWLSPFRDRPTLAVHATWVSDLDRVRPALSALESLLAPDAPRPHWGKVFGPRDASALQDAYPDAARFTALAERLDPERCFVNDYVERMGVR